MTAVLITIAVCAAVAACACHVCWSHGRVSGLKAALAGLESLRTWDSINERRSYVADRRTAR